MLDNYGYIYARFELFTEKWETSNMFLNETVLRRIIREELLEAIIRRRGGEETRIKTVDDMTIDQLHPINSIADIKISPRRLMMLTDKNNPWIPGPVFDKIYNQGVSEEPVMFKVKKNTGEDAIIRTVKYYNVKEGTRFIIPKLFNMANNSQTINQAFGVGTVVMEPENYETGVPGETAPLALVEFQDSQKPDGQLSRHAYVGIAFLKHLNYEESEGYAATYRFLKQKYAPKISRPSDEDEEI